MNRPLHIVRMFLCLAGLSLLVACGSSKGYIEPAETSAHALLNKDGEIVSPSGFGRILPTITMIDGKQAMTSMLGSFTSGYRVLPGEHKVTIHFQISKYEDSHVLGMAIPDIKVYESYVDVSANFVAGTTYRINAAPQGAGLDVWIETVQGQPASEKAAVGYRPMHVQAPMPIIITK